MVKNSWEKNVILLKIARNGSVVFLPSGPPPCLTRKLEPCGHGMKGEA